MSSILTNTSAMVALQTLKNINSDLSGTQAEISTGRKINSARDNSAIWAISQVMQSDVDGFTAISESLSLGSSSVAVARDASEQITNLLGNVKQKVVAAQEQNVDRNKIQTEISALRDQIVSIVSAAQFNGLNFLKDGGSVAILSSLDRASDGTVTASSITVAKNDMQTTAMVFGTTAVGAADDLLAVSGASIAVSGGTGTVSFTAGGAAAGASYRVSLTGAGTNELGTTQIDFSYVARTGDTELDVSKAMYDKMSAYFTSNSFANTTVARNATTGDLTITNNDATAGNTIALARTENLAGTAGGGLEMLGTMDVTTTATAAQALTDIEGLIQIAIDAAAEFGSAQSRVDIQSSFVSKLSDSMKSGIGSLIDADMEEASARLQALQVQQQLGIQALSIANQQPQNILSLFR
ncbi:MAG: flagellin [Paracoccaceae bacterium]